MQSPRTHRFNFGRVGLHLIEHHFFREALAEVFGERREHFFVYGGVFHRRVSEYNRIRVFQFLGILRRIGNEVFVLVAKHGVQIAAVFTFLCERGAAGGNQHYD